MDEWNFDDFNFDSEMDGQWNRHTEMEICLKTFDGTQHLRLHGWLKRNDTLIKMESFTTELERKHLVDSHFGSFIVYITEKSLKKLKDENLEKGLFMDLEILSNEDWDWLVKSWHRLPGWKDSSKGLLRLKSKFIIASQSNGNIELILNMSKNCFGLFSLDNGHSLNPEPPERIIGLIFIFYRENRIRSWFKLVNFYYIKINQW